MTLRTKFTDQLKQAMKARNELATATIRLITSTLKDKDIAARTAGKPELADTDILGMLQTMVKQRQESARIYHENARPELAEREEAEIKIIETFMPAQMSEDDTKAAINAIIAELNITSIKDMGKVMNELKTRYAGQIDMGRAGGLVKGALS